MGWKNFRDYFNLQAIVQVNYNNHHEPMLYVGSGYIPDMIIVNFRGELVKGFNQFMDKENTLAVLQQNILAEPEKVKELLNTPDTFEMDLPIFCFIDGVLVEKKCEQYGFPNITHDGYVIYDNMFFKTDYEAIRHEVFQANCAIDSCKRQIQTHEKNITELKSEQQKYEQFIKKFS